MKDKQQTPEEKWKAYCTWKGIAYLPLWEVKAKYADLPLALREYCYLKECDKI
jgi:hypothetical protein